MNASISERWSDLYKDRHSWAHRAYDRLLRSLSVDVRQRLACVEQGEESYVVVFGRTQVGKTTLILDLMGISGAAMPRVSKVLRGGRDPGESSTSTAMEYARSSSNSWTLADGVDVSSFSSDEDMAHALGHLRHRMESGELSCTAPCKVAIPSDCFIAESWQPKVRILDLPGAAAKGRRERAHVAEMARQHVPLADLILLVGRGDSLDFLKPEALNLPGIEDWQLVPSRFRIVTTFSFTSQSVRELVRSKSSCLDETLIRQRLIEQIEKAVPLSVPARQVDRYYPLEFGYSWQALQHADPVFHQMADSIVQRLKIQLLADIRASTSPLARIKNAVLAHEVVTQVKEMRHARALSDRSILSDADSRSNEQIARLRVAHQAAIDSACRARERLGRMDPEANQASLTSSDDDPAYPYLTPKIPSGAPRRSVSDLLDLAEMARRALLSEVVRTRPLQVEGSRTVKGADTSLTHFFWRELPDIPASSAHRIAVDEAFSAFETRLRGYVLDTYWRSSSHQSDVDALTAAEHSARVALAVLWRRQWLSAARVAYKKAEGELKTLDSDVFVWEQRVRSAEDEATQIRDSMKDLDEKSAEAQRSLDADLAQSRRFLQMLDEEYLDELKARREAQFLQSDPTRRLLGLLAALQLPYTRQEFYLATD